jgi:uncharacterized protein
MGRDEVITKLRAHEAELKHAVIVHLSLFGSTVRGEHSPMDIDLLADFDPGRDLSLLDVVHIENHLSDLLASPVDLVEERTLKPRVKKSVDADDTCLLEIRFNDSRTFSTT